MSLHEVEGAASAFTGRSLAGQLDRLVVHSETLEGNPLGDPARRELYVYRPPQSDGQLGLPAVYLLQGFAGRLEEWLQPTSTPRPAIEVFDAMFAGGDCPPALLVLVDASTSRGTSQFLNSDGTGRYLDYVCDEVVPFVDTRYPSAAMRDRRGVAGVSSGGYGALAMSMMRDDVFGALASHAGDALFEACYQPFFPPAARELRDRFEGSWSVFHERISLANWRESPLLFAAYGTACAYSPDTGRPGEALMPFEPDSGRPIAEVWRRWLELDPVRMVERHAEALRGMRAIHLEAGRADDFFLDLGAQALSRELTRVGVAHTLELFDGSHEIPVERQAAAVRALVAALGDEQS